MTRAGRIALGVRARKAPSPVATPLPPLKRRKTGQQLPTMASTAPAVRAAEVLGPEPSWGDVALEHVPQEGGDGRHRAEGAQHVGGADGSAPPAADVEAPGQARDEESHRDGPDQVHDDQTERSHGQRSWSLMMARGPALRKNR